MAHTVLVTGGVSGIGAATCRLFKTAGHRVIANYAHDETHATAFGSDTGIAVRKWDVADFAACQAAINSLESEFGPVEILINNAGVTRDAVLHKMSIDQWQAVINIDLTGVFNVTRHVIEGMRARNFGRIINVSSVNAQSGQFGQTNYCAAKAGVIGFTKALALESAAHGITVNAIAPGYTDTPMVGAVPAKVLQTVLANVPAGRLASADEIARAILFLADDSSGFVTGATLSVNGGKYMA